MSCISDSLAKIGSFLRRAKNLFITIESSDYFLGDNGATNL